MFTNRQKITDSNNDICMQYTKPNQMKTCSFGPSRKPGCYSKIMKMPCRTIQSHNTNLLTYVSEIAM